MSNADSIRITIYGKGGHGSQPNSTIDPIVIAARTLVALQTIVSREVRPGEVVVVTVGYIQAGTKNNIIPDQAEFGITVRSYKPEIRKQVRGAIDRIAKAEANAASAVREPRIELYEATDAVYNDPPLEQRMEPVLVSALSKDNVVTEEPAMASEVFPILRPRAFRRSTSAWVAPIRRSMSRRKRPERICLPTIRRCSLLMWIPLCTPQLKLKFPCCDLLGGSAEELRKSVSPARWPVTFCVVPAKTKTAERRSAGQPRAAVPTWPTVAQSVVLRLLGP